RAWVSCGTEYAGDAGDGVELEGLQREQIGQALAPCAERGLMRVRYAGKINPGFAEMMWRLAVVADEQKIHKRILDLAATGVQV
ncbi:hypothetical protein, partial [Enterobacter hormaechei]|uniref:hypothetical protein n=1 Tax=Enterobacter hormaechei TaxID=158836 RepID=UPI00203EEC15